MIAAAEDWRARKASSGANGSFRAMTTVYLSGAVTASTCLKTTMPREPTFPQRFSDATTSSDVISLPLWKSTPRRSLNVCVRPFELMLWDSTSIGWGRSSRRRRTGVSKIAVAMLLGHPDRGGRVVEGGRLAGVGDPQRAAASRGLPVDRGARGPRRPGPRGRSPESRVCPVASIIPPGKGRSRSGYAGALPRVIVAVGLSHPPRPRWPPKYSPAPPGALARPLTARPLTAPTPPGPGEVHAAWRGPYARLGRNCAKRSGWRSRSGRRSTSSGA